MAGRLFFLGVVIDVEVRGLKDSKIESIVVDLIAAEVLRFRDARGGERGKQAHDDRRAPKHGHP